MSLVQNKDTRIIHDTKYNSYSNDKMTDAYM